MFVFRCLVIHSHHVTLSESTEQWVTYSLEMLTDVGLSNFISFGVLSDASQVDVSVQFGVKCR